MTLERDTQINHPPTNPPPSLPEIQSPGEFRQSASWWTRGTIAFGSIGLMILLVFLLQQSFGKATIDNGMTHKISRSDLTVTIVEQGTLESSNNTEVKSKVRGFNTVTWVVEVGTIVKKGDELVRLDTKAIEENVSLNKTNVHTARATLERTKANVAKAKIALDAYEPNHDAEMFTTQIRPLLIQFCVNCHSQKTQEGELNLERFTSMVDIRKNIEPWRAMISKLETGEMPPKDQPEPTAEDRKVLVDWTKRLVAAEASPKGTSSEANATGRFNAQQQTIQQAIEIAQLRLTRSKEILDRSTKLFLKGFLSKLELEADEFLVKQNELELSVKKTELAVLEKYTKGMELATLRGEVTATKSKLQADDSGLKMDEGRLKRVSQELEDCLIYAPRDGLVIYPSAAEWKATPDITEGATVRMDQVLLLMPDLDKMQVKVGVHESIIDRLDPGCKAKVTLTDRVIEAKVSSVANVTKPAGWWTGNVVKYDTIIELPATEGLKPGMSAEVEIVLAEHQNVLTIPVAAVIETEKGTFCWTATPEGPKRRTIKLGDSNDVFIVVKDGLTEGDEVVMNPLAHIDQAQDEVQNSLDDESDISKP